MARSKKYKRQPAGWIAACTWRHRFKHAPEDLKEAITQGGFAFDWTATKRTRRLDIEGDTRLIWWPSTGRIRCRGKQMHAVLDLIERVFAP